MESTSALEINVNNWKLYLPLESIYMGPNRQDSLYMSRSDTTVPPDSIKVVLKGAQAFHIKAVGQIQKRFHFKDDIYKYAEMVDPVSAQSLQPASLLPFVRKYGQIPWDGTKTEQE